MAVEKCILGLSTCKSLSAPKPTAARLTQASHTLSQRHQLNHNSPQTFRCEYPECSRTFVRPDLLKRHLDRHIAKGSQFNERRTDAGGSLSPQPFIQNSSPEAVLYQPSFSHQNQTYPGNQIYSVGDGDRRHFGNITADSHIPPPPASIAQVSNGHLPAQHVANRNTHHMDPGYEYPAAKYPQTPGMHTVPHEAPQIANQMTIMDQMSMADAGPVFGANAGLHKSPSGGMPEDFMAYLFDSTSDTSAAGTSMLPAAAIK